MNTLDWARKKRTAAKKNMDRNRFNPEIYQSLRDTWFHWCTVIKALEQMYEGDDRK